jgi:NADPH-dependent curcumin reductase CurA
VVVGVCALLAVGVAVGRAFGGSSHGAGDRVTRTPGAATNTGAGAVTPTIDMHDASPEACAAPIAPGKGHADTTVSQIFHVTDSTKAQYLLGWQVVPYDGAHTYSVGASGALVALEPPTSGKPLGFGVGSLTFTGNGTAGSIDATVKLDSGATVRVTGKWSCAGHP